MSVWTAPPLIDKGRKPNKIIPVPPEYRRITLLRERDLLVHDLLINTNCVVVPHSDQSRITRFDIHGTSTAVERAVAQINKWIANAHIKSKASSAWAKMPAFNANDWYYDQVTEMETGRKQMFKEAVPELAEDAPKLPSAIVDWPEDLRSYPITPRDAFGNKLEVLNELRMRDEVFITLLPNNNGLWQVEITGYEARNVPIAEEHYRTMIDKVRADTLGMQHPLNMILDETEGLDVVLEEAEDWWPSRTDKVVPRLVCTPMMYNPGTFRRDGLHSAQLGFIQRSFEQALDAVRRKKGSYDFAIRLGSLVLGSKSVSANDIGKILRKEDFLKAIDSRVDILVKKWVFDTALGLKVLRRLAIAEHLLEPTKAAGFFGYLPATLKETRPMFRGTWVFRDPNALVSQPAPAPFRHAGRPNLPQQPTPATTAPSAPITLYVVQTDWTDDEDGLYEKSETRFYKLPPGKMAPKVNMDINLLELGESRGWSFALESLIPVQPQLVSAALTGFAKSVTMQPKYDVRSNNRFARWESTPTVKKHLVTYRMDKIYSFAIKETCYKVELTAMWYPMKQTPVWGLAVRHIEWATHLAELERLPVGDQARWGDTISTFLPDDGQMSSAHGPVKKQVKLDRDEKQDEPPRTGIRILVGRLMQISEIVSSVTALADGGVALQG
ncbi:hypothetical protein T440DRAFT_494916 [Plenodomus tracheiphilus IPT5]|uniref:DUF7905 domain-containing protein n=1 Tax=Plenodomus tracheiphilus IPT5 TaxID=1408161 RepID=A0A6A7BLB7_9PLEO|nr:hypothetical protein T440DRAFT_494916 [Plenodomus tracheiphilus IPT5]